MRSTRSRSICSGFALLGVLTTLSSSHAQDMSDLYDPAPAAEAAYSDGSPPWWVPPGEEPLSMRTMNRSNLNPLDVTENSDDESVDERQAHERCLAEARNHDPEALSQLCMLYSICKTRLLRPESYQPEVGESCMLAIARANAEFLTCLLFEEEQAE